MHTDDALGRLPPLLGHDAHRPGADEKKLAGFMSSCPAAPANVAAKARK